MPPNEEKQAIELVPLEFIKPLPRNITVIGREQDMMLRTDMTRIESDGLYKIDPILLRKLTPLEIEEIKAKEPWSQACYQIIDGHSRWEAAKDLGWRQIRAIIIDCTLEEAYAINYTKNKARGTIHPLREAMYFRHLHEDLKMTQEKIAEKLGLTQGRVSQVMKSINVSEEARREIISRLIPYREKQEMTGRHLEAIASIPEPEKQVRLVDTIIEGKLSAKQTEKAKKAIEKGLTKEEAIKAAKAPAVPIGEIEIGNVKCSHCGLSFKILHIDEGKHKLKKVE
jgi:ParB/RepB/Spo0J family partition protein